MSKSLGKIGVQNLEEMPRAKSSRINKVKPISVKKSALVDVEIVDSQTESEDMGFENVVVAPSNTVKV